MTKALLLAISILCTAQSVAAQSNIPPPAARKETAPVASGIGDANKAKSVLIDGSTAVLQGAGLSPNAGDLKRAGSALNTLSRVVDAGKVAEAYIRGDQADMFEKGAAAFIDQCVDKAVDYGCAALGVSTTFGAPATYAACKAGASAAIFVVEKCTNGSVGDHVAAWGRKKFSPSGVHQPTSVPIKRAQLQGQMSRVKEANETFIEQQFVPTFSSEPNDYYSGAESSTFVDALMQGLQSNQSKQTSANDDTTVCHANHDEAAHPGGCHDDPNSGN